MGVRDRERPTCQVNRQAQNGVSSGLLSVLTGKKPTLTPTRYVTLGGSPLRTKLSTNKMDTEVVSMTQGMWTLCQHLEMGNIQVQCEASQRLVQGSTSMWGDPPANGAGVKAGGLLSGELPLNDHHG